MTAPITVAEIAVRLAAGMAASGRGVNWSYAIQEAAEGYEALLASGHIAPEPEPVAGPDWSQAPEWAQFSAQDHNGAWWWYEHEPKPNSWNKGWNCWTREHGEFVEAVTNPHWRESLQRRPGGG